MKKLIVLTGICSALLALPAMAGPDGKGDGEKGKRPDGKGGKGGQRPSPEQVLQKLDTDKSGGISLAEFKAGPMAQRAKDPKMVEERYNRMDANSDGTVDQKELAASFKKMAGRRGGPDGKGGKGRPDGGKGKPRPDRPDADAS